MLLPLAIVSMAICIGITLYAARKTDTNGGQSVRDSMIEAWENIVIGFSINFVANIFIIPMVAEGMTLWENFLMGWLYTAVSMIRSFGVRRWNNSRQIKKQEALANGS